jgi:hypothetical protein
MRLNFARYVQGIKVAGGQASVELRRKYGLLRDPFTGAAAEGEGDIIKWHRKRRFFAEPIQLMRRSSRGDLPVQRRQA